MVLSALVVCALLGFAAFTNVIAGLLSDPRVDPRKELLAAGIAYVPNSATVNARLAAIEMTGGDRDISVAEGFANRAVSISPWDYGHRLLLATVKEAQGDRAAAEQALQDALALAPNYTEVHWRLANLLLREGKLARAVGEFRIAASSDSELLPSIHDLLWRVSAGNLTVVQAATPNDPKSRLVLSQFLLKQSRTADAITVYAGIDRNSLLGLPDGGAFIDSLITGGHFQEARGLWIGLVSGAYEQPGHPLPAMWNGGFESDISKSLGQFDWIMTRNEYAVPSIDSSTAHSGSRSLRIEFTGRDTTRLDGQVKQTISVRPGARYQLESYVKTDRLDTPEGPRMVVAETSQVEIAASAPVSIGSSDWRRIAVDFTAPSNARAVVVTIKRIPKFSYDNPTRGSVWLDDFVLTEQSK